MHGYACITFNKEPTYWKSFALELDYTGGTARIWFSHLFGNWSGGTVLRSPNLHTISTYLGALLFLLEIWRADPHSNLILHTTHCAVEEDLVQNNKQT